MKIDCIHHRSIWLSDNGWSVRIFDQRQLPWRVEIAELTNGAGVDLAIEAVGNTEPVNTAIDSVRKGGSVVLVGNISPEIKLPLQKVVSRQLRLQGSCASAGEYPKAIELMSAGAIKVKPLISAVAPLADGPQWFERLYAREPNLMKVVLTPGNPS